MLTLPSYQGKTKDFVHQTVRSVATGGAITFGIIKGFKEKGFGTLATVPLVTVPSVTMPLVTMRPPPPRAWYPGSSAREIAASAARGVHSGIRAFGLHIVVLWVIFLFCKGRKKRIKVKYVGACLVALVATGLG